MAAAALRLPLVYGRNAKGNFARLVQLVASGRRLPLASIRNRRSLLYVGNLAGSSVRVGELFRDPVRRCAAGIVVVHNHPSGDPSPSAEDLRITGEIGAAGALLDIALLDHLVIGHGRWVSLRALGAC